MESIRNAATQYSTEGREPQREERKESNWENSKTTSRAKSIAEKLGFINFDEEELDTPTYLRKEEEEQRREERPRTLDI